jgi:hypothetical protein
MKETLALVYSVFKLRIGFAITGRIAVIGQCRRIQYVHGA